MLSSQEPRDFSRGRFSIDQRQSSVFVEERDTGKILYMNSFAKNHLFYQTADGKQHCTEPDLLELVRKQPHQERLVYHFHHDRTYLGIDVWELQWKGKEALVCVTADITELVQEKEVLAKMAYRDQLTALYNRRYAMELLNANLQRKAEFVLLLIDLDNLKYVNDTFGHLSGDEFIQAATASLLAELPQDGVACRVGGDEFFIFLYHVNTRQARKYISQTLQRFMTNKFAFPCSFSYGIMEIKQDNELPVEDILHQIDEKMYRFKRKNRKKLL